MASFTIAPRLKRFATDGGGPSSGGLVISEGAELVSRNVPPQRMRVTGRLNVTSGDVVSGRKFWVQIALFHPDGSTTALYSQGRTGAGNITFDVTLPTLTPEARYSIHVRGIYTTSNNLPPSSWDPYHSSIRCINTGGTGFCQPGVRATLYTNRRPGKPVIVSPPSGTSVAYNDGEDSIRTLVWDASDEDAGTNANDAEDQDRGGYQLQYRPMPSTNNPNPAWEQVRGRARGATGSGQGAYWEGQVTASVGLPAQYITPGASAPANNTLGGLGSNNIAASFFWIKEEVDMVAADLLPPTIGTHPQMRQYIPAFRLPPGGWQIRVRTFDMSAHGRTSITSMNPTSISEWSDPIALYITAPYLPPLPLRPIDGEAVTVDRIDFEWLFRDPRPTGGEQAQRRIRLRRRDGQDVFPPSPDRNLLSNPDGSLGAGGAEGWLPAVAAENSVTALSSESLSRPGGSSDYCVFTGRTNADGVSRRVSYVQAAGHPSTMSALPGVEAGKQYTYSVYIRPFADDPPTLEAIVGLRFHDADNNLIGSPIAGEVTPLPAEEYTRVHLTTTAPANAVKVNAVVEVLNPVGTPAVDSTVILYDDAMLNEGALLPYAPPPPAPPPPSNAPPQGTLNLCQWPSEDRSIVAWYGSDSNKYTDAMVTDRAYIGTRSFRFVRAQQASGDPIVALVAQAGIPTSPRPVVTAGQPYTFSLYMRPTSFEMRGVVGIRFFNSSGDLIGSTAWGAFSTLAANDWTRVHHTATAPAGAVSADTVAQANRPTGVMAANGDTVHMDAAMLNEGSTLYDYFDGNNPGAEWLGAVDGSQSRWVAPPEEVGGGWIEVIPEGQRDSALETYTWLQTQLEAGVEFEWQARTVSTPGNFDSSWSDSAFFWTAPEPGSGPVIPDPDETLPGPGLGCGNNRVLIATRGGMVQIGELTGLEQVRWDRLRDDISSATVVIQTGKDCDELLASLRTWQNEIIIYRDNGNGRPARVWEGPITRITWRADSVELAARDPMIYVYRRILRQGFSDAYVVRNGRVVSQPLSVTVRAGRIIQNALAYDDPNVLRYMRVLSRPDDARQSRVVADYSSTAWQVVDDFAARAGLDYTTVGRAIILWDTHHGIGRLPELGDGDFDSEPVVTEYGMQAANHYGVTNGSGVYGVAEHVDDEGRPLYYGWLEMLNSAYGEDDEAGSDETLTEEARAKLVQAFTDQARRNIQDRMPAPVVVRVPDNSTLSPDLNIDINHLVPGVYVPLRSSSTLREIVQVQKLDSVKVVQTSAGETVQVTLSPSHADDAGTGEGGEE